jgi:16S rRNA G1207 methylase RsmC
MQSASGIFSAQEFDKGTKLLLKHFKLSSNFLSLSSSPRVLDLGCGYGLVSYFLISRYASKVSKSHSHFLLDACDSSPLAIDVTTANIH